MNADVVFLANSERCCHRDQQNGHPEPRSRSHCCKRIGEERQTNEKEEQFSKDFNQRFSKKVNAYCYKSITNKDRICRLHKNINEAYHLLVYEVRYRRGHRPQKKRRKKNALTRDSSRQLLFYLLIRY